MCKCANAWGMCECLGNVRMGECANVRMDAFVYNVQIGILYIKSFAHFPICTFTLLFFQQSYGHLLVRFGLRGRIVVGRVVRYGELDRIIHLLVQ